MGNRSPLPSKVKESLRRLENLKQRLKRTGVNRSTVKPLKKRKLLEGIVEAADQPAQGVEFYIPHEPVIREEAAPTKVRAVYDASAKAHPNASYITSISVAVVGDLKRRFCEYELESLTVMLGVFI